MNTTKKLFECNICFDSLTSAKLCPECRYIACRSCFAHWFGRLLQERKSSACPQCKRSLDLNTVADCSDLGEYCIHYGDETGDETSMNQIRNDILMNIQKEFWEREVSGAGIRENSVPVNIQASIQNEAREESEDSDDEIDDENDETDDSPDEDLDEEDDSSDEDLDDENDENANDENDETDDDGEFIDGTDDENNETNDDVRFIW